MPKMKTHRGTAKRFKITGNKKIIRKKAFKSHILEKKSPKRKHELGKSIELSKADTSTIKSLLGV